MKKVIGVLLSIAFMICTINVLAVDYGEEIKNQPTKTHSQKFVDISSSHWAYDYINEMVERGILSGYPNGKFYPDNNVTRAEFAKIMTVTAGITISSYSEISFNDIDKNAWYTPYVNAAFPYLSGYSTPYGSYYYPNQPALREDITVALVKLKGYDIFGADESILTTMFTDTESISTEARKYVATALNRGLISGYEDDTFRGQSSITRAEAAAILWRAYQYGNDNKQFDTDTMASNIIMTTPSPTTVPTIITVNAPESTQKPTEKAEETIAPTIEPTDEPTTKPYIVKTIAKVDNMTHESYRLMTYDFNNDELYWYNRDKSTIYKYDTNKEKISEYLDVSLLKHNRENDIIMMTDEVKDDYIYTDFIIDNLYYDNYRNKLFISATSYTLSTLDGLEMIKSNIGHSLTFYIDNDEISNNLINWNVEASSPDFIIAGNRLLDEDSDVISMVDFPGWYDIIIPYDDKLYSLSTEDDKTSVIVYDFSSYQTLRTIYDHGDIKKTGANLTNFYMWYNNKIVRSSTDGDLSYLLDLNEDIMVTDNKPIENYTGRIFVTEDENHIFFTDSNSIRVIERSDI